MIFNNNFIKKTAGTTMALASLSAVAQDAVPAIDSGDNAFIMICAALVLFMTPGLAFFYAGMVKRKNATAVLFQNFSALGFITLLWGIAGYSLAFKGTGSFIGNLEALMLSGVGQGVNGSITDLTFMVFQGMFAVITPILISGAIAERVTFKGWLAFMSVWSLLVYAPVCHWVWGGGWLMNAGALDFAGGYVVHMTAGFSALAIAYLLGRGEGFGKENKAYNAGFVVAGTAMLWLGWFGFNAGSALSAGGVASQAFATTFFAAGAALVSWTIVDWAKKGQPSLVGACIGTVAGLVAITPAAGFVTVGSAIIIGLSAGVICNFAAIFVKKVLKVDDTLDVFACHGVGGTLGLFMTALFATKSVNEAGADGLFYGSSELLTTTLQGIGAVAIYSLVASFVIVKAVGAVVQLRASAEDEAQGLSISQHGEEIDCYAEKESTPASHRHAA